MTGKQAEIRNSKFTNALARLSVAGPQELTDVTFRIVDQSRYTEVIHRNTDTNILSRADHYTLNYSHTLQQSQNITDPHISSHTLKLSPKDSVQLG